MQEIGDSNAGFDISLFATHQMVRSSTHLPRRRCCRVFTCECCSHMLCIDHDDCHKCDLIHLTPLSQHLSRREPFRIYKSNSMSAVDVRENPTTSSDSTLPRPIRIAIYCDEYGQSWWPGYVPLRVTAPFSLHIILCSWNRTQLDRRDGGGLGGSEEAVIFLAEALAKRSVSRDNHR